jgi:hypothetical protein
MGYLGYKPADKPLTAADITDSIITSAKITDATIVNGDIANSTINLTTKVTGTLPLTNGGTGLATLGTAGQALVVNSGATALQYSTVGATAGQVIQVLSAYDSTGRTTTSTSFVTGSNTLSVSITPSSSSNKILIFVYTGFCRNDSGTGCYQTIYRNGSTNLGDATYGFQAIGGPGYPCSYSFLDSPATTSATTYQVYFRGTANTARLNQADTDYPFYKASITIMEVKG